MALFKIEKGLAENLSTKRPNTVEGYCYFTTNDGKFYIDTATANGTSNRVCLNAAKADKLRTARTITVNGDAEGSVSFDGSQNVTLTLDVPDLDELSTACSDLNKNKAPNNHASTETTYGKGDANNYGHVKLTDTISTSSTTGGTAATPNAVRTAYNLADTANTTANTNKTNIETINSTLETIQDDIEALENADKGKAPTNHASTATTYGGGTGSNYGHVKLSDATNSTSAASASIAATPKAVKAAYDLANTANTTANTNKTNIGTINSTISTMQDDIDALEEADKGKAPTSHASTATTYGKGDANNYGHLKLSDATNSTSSTTGGIAATPNAVKTAYDLANTANTTANTNVNSIKIINSTLGTMQDDIDALEEADKGKAPTNHASTATTYGKGDANNYGHVKLTDTISTSSTSGGVAATPNAVKTAYDLANTANTTANTNTSSINTINSTIDTIQDDIDALEEADKGKAPNNHASTATTYGTGTDSKYGHLKLSAATNSTSGVNGGVAATPSAVKAAYDLASSKVDSLSDLGITATAATLNSVATDTDQLHKVWKTSSTGAPGWRTDAARYLQTFYQDSAPNDNGTTYGDNWKFYAQWITNDRLAFKVENNGANQASYPVEVNHAYKLVTPSTDSNSANAPLSVGSATKPVYFSKGVPVETNEFANKSEGAFFIEGSGTTDETAKTSTWTGESTRITEYYDGLTIRYKIGVKGQSTITLNINGLGEKIVYRIGTTKLTTQFTVGSIINLTYHADLNEGCWMCNDYDANTQSNTNSTDTSSKIFLVGATSQGSNKTTYSHGEVYVGTDHHVYSNSKQVVNLSDTQALTNKTYNGYTLGAACAKGVDTSVTDGSSNLVTGDAVHTAITKVKNDLLNGAGTAYDTLKELGDLIDDNTDAIEALETVAANKAASTITITGTNGLTGGGNLTANRTISADLLSTTKLTNAAATATETAGRVYPVAMDKNGKLAVNIPWTNTTYNEATTSAAGLMSADDKAKLDGIATQANKYSLPTASSSTLGGVKIGSNINISSGAISVPAATKDKAGVTVVYPAASCTTFSSDSGTITPLAAQKSAELFAITRPPKRNSGNPANPGEAGTCTTNNIVRWLNAAGDVQDSKIAIEDVTNTRDTTKKAQVISIPAEGGKKMVYGYCTDQVDGTSFIGGVFDANATTYPYAQGLAIGGTSGNLLWKGKVVATTDQIPTIPTSLKNPNSLTIQGNGTTLTNGVYDGSAAKTVNITASSIGAAPSSHTHDDRYYTESETNTKLNAKLDKLTYEWNKEYSAGGTAGYLLIGSFPMYDTNVTIDIDATTSTTYHGTVVIATQNVSTTSIGSSRTITVYGDPTGAISDAIKVTWASGSRNYNVYFVPSTWSKNLIHIRAIGQYMDTIDTTKICTQFTAGTAPATTRGLTVVNALKSNFNNFTYTHPTTSGNKHIPSGGSSGQFLKWSANGTATWSADNNTTYSFATGDNNGQIKVTPSGGTAQNISVRGLGSAAYTNSTAYDAAGAATTALSNAKAYADGKFLPLSGGTITGTSGDTPLWIQSAHATGSFIGFKSSNGTTQGYLGVNSGAPTFYDNGNKTIYHTGNLKIGAPSATVTVNSVTNAGSVSTLTSSVANKCLSLTFTTGTNTTYSRVTVANSSHTHTPSVG